MSRASELLAIRRALEVVSVGTALREIGFVLERPEGETLRWTGLHAGIALRFLAGQDWFDQWRLVASGQSPNEWIWDETILPVQAPRGQVVQTVRDMWKRVFPRAAAPQGMALGDLYARHRQDIRRVAPGLPTIRVDGEVLRATRRWLAQRFGLQGGDVGPLPDQPLALSMGDGLLTIEVAYQVFACPAQGVWVEDCAISLRKFLAMPVARLRGASVSVERSAGALAFEGYGLPIALRDDCRS